MGVGLVIEQFEVFEGEVINGFDLRVDFHTRKRERLASELKPGLLEVIGIEVEITESVHEFAGFVSTNLRNHHGEEGIGGDVERNPKEKVGAALIELAAQAGRFRPGIVNVELEKKVAGWESHFIDLADIPRGDEMASGSRVVFEPVNQLADLVNGGAIGLGP